MTFCARSAIIRSDKYAKTRECKAMIDEGRLKILTEGAKYDVSCSSSGSRRKNTAGGLGNASFGGICHSFAADGRCISLLKILLSNDCVFDCKYCPNRRSADVARATLSPEEICELTIGFYRRNYIEGLFLSSAVYKNPDFTMELLLQTARLLRYKYRFNGYLHLKGIPGANSILVDQAAYLADRMSYNLELPGEESLKKLAPQKTKKSLLLPMRQLFEGKKQFAYGKKAASGATISGENRLLAADGMENDRGIGAIFENNVKTFTDAPTKLVAVGENAPLSQTFEKKRTQKSTLYLPAGQTTQMIVGASPESDGKILRLSRALYQNFSMKRVYFSAYLPVVDDQLLPTVGEKLLREHRLYQADWLLRYYGFSPEEIANENENLPVEYDPKCAWAIKNPQLFPVEINRADLATLLRVPGIGVRSANKIIAARKYSAIQFEHLKKMRVVLKRARHFITCNGKFYGERTIDRVKTLLSAAETSDSAKQLSLFSDETLLRSFPKSTLNAALPDLERIRYESAKQLPFDGKRTDLPADETQKKIALSTAEIRRSVLTGEI